MIWIARILVFAFMVVLSLFFGWDDLEDWGETIKKDIPI